ncbi:DUF4188 domain-containing protein [Rhodococcoides kyotonense]|uniref:Uncharacterized protein n=1 Tax=Rhodococcoides kyotonense TaxID=398843 RepID=A0A239CK82_9NOCA|nr:DUF4188 domain-containing protein [Rhodococcus kyotonensis]SNS20656.1 protein of unknown function [Rhodococcus kyotonensis]
METNRVLPGRHTARIEGDFVVFVIGIRINKWRKVRRWVRPFFAMPAMLKELRAHPEAGLLDARIMLGGRTFTLIQYWRSFDQLEKFAKNPDDLHLPAWRNFNRSVGSSGDVGVFHETYRVGPGDHESIYVNMPVVGLAAAGASIAVDTRTDTARRRLDT